MNSGNGKTSAPHRLLKSSNRNVVSSNLSIYYTWKNIKKSYKNNKFKISTPMWNEKFELPDGSNSVSHIQDYFDYIIKKHQTVTENPLLKNICKQK